MAKGLFRTQWKIYDGVFFAKIDNGEKLSTIFAKKDPSWIFDWFLNALLVAMVFFLFIATVGNITENGFFHGCSQPAFQQWKQQSNV